MERKELSKSARLVSKTMTEISKRKRIGYTFIIILCLICIIEGASYLVGLYLKSKYIFYTAQLTNDYKNYISMRDSILGWPDTKRFGKDDLFDKIGSRIIPSFPDPFQNKSIISMYGDSFTFGDEVSNEHSIANYLSLLIDKRVSNFGVGGYGTDQALLRYQLNRNDSSKIVILNHYVRDIIRNVNQYRDIIATTDGLGFKPRFVLEDSNLIFKPIINLNENNFLKVIEFPEEFLENDFFVKEMLGGFYKLKFPFSISIVKSLWHFNIKTKVSGWNFYYDFYQEGHASNALKLTEAIIMKFIQEAKARDQIPIIAITPNYQCFEFYDKKKQWPYQNLINGLGKNGIKIFNIGEALIQQNEKLNMCNIYINCTGHFNENGNKVVADLFYQYLIENKYLN